jgi:hypothetical protein
MIHSGCEARFDRSARPNTPAYRRAHRLTFGEQL